MTIRQQDIALLLKQQGQLVKLLRRQRRKPRSRRRSAFPFGLLEAIVEYPFVQLEKRVRRRIERLMRR